MVSLISNIDSACQCRGIIFSLVREKSFICWEVVIWVILVVSIQVRPSTNL